MGVPEQLRPSTALPHTYTYTIATIPHLCIPQIPKATVAPNWSLLILLLIIPFPFINIPPPPLIPDPQGHGGPRLVRHWQRA